MIQLAGKAAVVTGGGSGIGRGLAIALAKEGAKVVVADIIKENADAVAAEIKRAGASAVAAACDVCERASIAKLKAVANQAFGRISLLFANAGATSFDRLMDMPDNDVDWIIQVNLMGVTNCVRAFLPDMIAAREGHLTATASMAGVLPGWIPNHAPYSAAKAGIIGMMMNLRLELAESGIGTTIYCPGGVASGMKENNALYRPARFGGPGQKVEIHTGNFFQKHPVTFLPAEEVAPMVLQAVRNNRPIVLDHSNQRQVFMDTYVAPMLAAFDEAEAYERSGKIKNRGSADPRQGH
jgi:NAD(P)-dependent dehydrogenase (short-subunit alcohol dehydrogenase family)